MNSRKEGPLLRRFCRGLEGRLIARHEGRFCRRNRSISGRIREWARPGLGSSQSSVREKGSNNKNNCEDTLNLADELLFLIVQRKCMQFRTHGGRICNLRNGQNDAEFKEVYFPTVLDQFCNRPVNLLVFYASVYNLPVSYES